VHVPAALAEAVVTVLVEPADAGADFALALLVGVEAGGCSE